MLEKDLNQSLISKAMSSLLFFLPPLWQTCPESVSKWQSLLNSVHSLIYYEGCRQQRTQKSLSKNNLSHFIMHRLLLISQMEWKNEKYSWMRPNLTGRKISLLANFTMQQDQFSSQPLKASIPMPYDIQRHRDGSSELLSMKVPTGLEANHAKKIPRT